MIPLPYKEQSYFKILTACDILSSDHFKCYTYFTLTVTHPRWPTWDAEALGSADGEGTDEPGHGLLGHRDPEVEAPVWLGEIAAPQPLPGLLEVPRNVLEAVEPGREGVLFLLLTYTTHRHSKYHPHQQNTDTVKYHPHLHNTDTVNKNAFQ